MMKLRLDVDYPYPSRMKGFLYVALNRKSEKNYLKNSKIIAKMVNESTRELRAYWFFTPYTTPDPELLELLHSDRHEVALHIATDPYAEMESLEKATQRKLNYYTVHGTERILARIMWKRKLSQAKINVPNHFPLQSFYVYPTLGLDRICYEKPTEEAVRIAEATIAKGDVLHIHPEWLFQRGSINHRGPFYETLRQVLGVDTELETLVTRKKGFARISSYDGTLEYQRNFVPTDRFLEKLAERGSDIFTFLERKWCCTIPNPPDWWVKTEDNIALLNVTSYEDWLEQVGKKTRNMVRKAEKSDVRTEVVEPNDALAEGIWKVYNETPIRQNRAFPHYGESMNAVKALFTIENATYLAAFLQNEVIGFIQLVHGDRIIIISQILSLQKHSDKAVNNALIAKSVEICASEQRGWLMYGRMGNHPSLDNFKQNNGFTKQLLTRYYVPITGRGRLAIRLGMHRELKDALPNRIKYALIPVYNWVSRNKPRKKG
jgi:hypothetical protein